MMRGLGWLLVLVAMLMHAHAVNYVYDETLWTKSTWPSFKVDYPLRGYNPTDDESITPDLKDLVKSSKYNSLDGPMPRGEGSPFMGFSKDQNIMDVMDDADMADHAAEAVKCTVCHTLMSFLWDHAVVAAHQGRSFKQADTEMKLASACQSKVIEDVLRRQAIYKMEAQAGAAAVVFFVVRDRRKDSERTLSEEIAVNKACLGLTQEHSKVLVAALLEAAAVYRERVELLKVSGRDEEDEYLDEDDDEEPTVDSDCVDLHHMCPSWAKIGECDANPNYMVGTRELRGHCRLSCGVCAPKLDLTASLAALQLTSAALAELEGIRAGLLQQLRNLGCTGAKACVGGASTTAAQGGMVQIKQLATTPWALGKPFHGRAKVSAAPQQDAKAAAAASALVKAAARNAAAAAAGSAGGSASAAALAIGSAGDDTAEGAVLAKELGGQILAIPDDFFLYQFVYRSHIRQFHEEAGKVTEDWSLGRYSGEVARPGDQASGAPLVLDKLDMLPDAGMTGGEWPYFIQEYSGGDVCTLKGGKTVPRHVQARFACSPDGKMHMLVREPEFCSYVFVIYSPALCSLERYKPFSSVPPGS